MVVATGIGDRLNQLGPVTPADLFATLLHLLGVKHDASLTDLDGRVLPATNGTPLKDLL